MAQPSRLTIALIEATCAPKDSEVWLSDDDGSRGAGRLALRVGASGSRLFYFRYFADHKRVLLPLGRYARVPTPNCLTLEEARDVALRYSFSFRNAETPSLRAALLERLSTPAASVQRSADSGARPLVAPAAVSDGGKGTVLELCNAYVAHLRKQGKQSANAVAGHVKNHVQSTPWAELPASELTAEQATDLIRRVVDAGHTTTARHVHQHLHAAFNMAKSGSRNAMAPAAFKEFGVSSNPISDTSLKVTAQARTRAALTKLELGHVLLDLTDSRHDLSVTVRALRLDIYLGGQRCLQLLRCKLSDVDLEAGLITQFDGKGNRPTKRIHTLPMTDTARTEVRALRQMALDLGSPYLIPGKVKGAALTSSPMSHAVNRLSKRLLASKKLGESFCYANIRSTIETNMAALEISLDTRSEIQSHGQSGVQKKHYDQWKYIPQKLNALNAWDKFLREAIELAKADLATQC